VPSNRALAAAFPASYAVHLLEEALVGGGFPAWLGAHAGADVSWPEFLLLNAAGMAVMVGVATGIWRDRIPRLGLAALGTITVVNGALHLGGSILTASYSPGVVSGTLVWLPLGATALRQAASGRIDRPVLLGVLLGLIGHSAISLAALRL